MASDEANTASIVQLRQELLVHNIWAWPKGSFEHMVGIAQKNVTDAIAGKCEKLDQANPKSLANRSECHANCRWLQSPGMRQPEPIPLAPASAPSTTPICLKNFRARFHPRFRPPTVFDPSPPWPSAQFAVVSDPDEGSKPRARAEGQASVRPPIPIRDGGRTDGHPSGKNSPRETGAGMGKERVSLLSSPAPGPVR